MFDDSPHVLAVDANRVGCPCYLQVEGHELVVVGVPNASAGRTKAEQKVKRTHVLLLPTPQVQNCKVTDATRGHPLQVCVQHMRGQVLGNIPSGKVYHVHSHLSVFLAKFPSAASMRTVC